MGRSGYLQEFRRRVVDLVAAGRKMAEVASDRGVSQQTIYTWDRQDRIDGDLGPGTEDGGQQALTAANKRIRELGVSTRAFLGTCVCTESAFPHVSLRGASGGTRTPKGVNPLGPKPSASASSATLACAENLPLTRQNARTARSGSAGVAPILDTVWTRRSWDDEQREPVDRRAASAASP
jgi:transposase